MTWDINNFATLSRSSEGSTVTSLLIENVAFVEDLKHNLLNISQLCDKGLRIIFYDSTCNIMMGKVIRVYFSVFMRIMFISLIC